MGGSSVGVAGEEWEADDWHPRRHQVSLQVPGPRLSVFYSVVYHWCASDRGVVSGLCNDVSGVVALSSCPSRAVDPVDRVSVYGGGVVAGDVGVHASASGDVRPDAEIESGARRRFPYWKTTEYGVFVVDPLIH